MVLRLKVMSHSSSGVSSAALFLLTPALFTAMSSAPSRSTTVSTILLHRTHQSRFLKRAGALQDSGWGGAMIPELLLLFMKCATPRVACQADGNGL